jgi:hypothetical protein
MTVGSDPAEADNRHTKIVRAVCFSKSHVGPG